MSLCSKHRSMSTVALGVMPVHTPSSLVVKSDVESMVFGVERLPVGIIQGAMISSPMGTLQRPGLEMVNEPGANRPERGRRSVRAEKTTIVGL